MPDLEWLATRIDAQQVACPHCHAAPGHTCTREHARTRDRVPLEHLPAHDSRIRLARNTQANNERSPA